MITESLNIPKVVVCLIRKEHLRKRKLYERFVPHSLTPDQWEDRATSCQGIIAMVDEDNFFKKIITGDETWCLPMTPKQSDRNLNGLVRLSLDRRN